MKKQLFAFLATFVLCLGIVSLLLINADLRKKKAIAERNVSVLTTQNVAYRTKSGQSVMKAEELNLTLNHYRNTIQGKDNTIRELKHQLRRILERQYGIVLFFVIVWLSTQ